MKRKVIARPSQATGAVLEKRVTVGVHPKAFMQGLGLPSMAEAAKHLGYSSSAPSNWEKAGRLPYAVYLAYVDQFGRDERGHLPEKLADFMVPVDFHGAFLSERIRPYAGLHTLPKRKLELNGHSGHAPLTVTPASHDAPASESVAVAPVKRKYRKRQHALTHVPEMGAKEMRQFINERAHHHVNGARRQQSLGITLDIPDGFGGSSIRVEVMPRPDLVS